MGATRVPALNDEQRLEVAAFVEARRAEGKNNETIATMLGLKSKAAVSSYMNLGSKVRPGKAVYVKVKEWEQKKPETNGHAKDVEVVKVTINYSPRGVLQELESAKKHIDGALRDLKRAHDGGTLLIKAGLKQLIAQLEESRKWLNIE